MCSSATRRCRRGPEEASYEVLDQLGQGTEVRHYAPLVVAEVRVPGTDGAARRRAFRLLFRYISGANTAATALDREGAMTIESDTRGEPRSGSEKVAMTVPVEVAAAAGETVMRFVLPADHTAATAPRPTDPMVTLHTLPARTMAVHRFSGFGRGPQRDRRRARLMQALSGSRWRPEGAWVRLAYDPPWTPPFLRRNEVAVPVVTAATRPDTSDPSRAAA